MRVSRKWAFRSGGFLTFLLLHPLSLLPSHLACWGLLILKSAIIAGMEIEITKENMLRDSPFVGVKARRVKQKLALIYICSFRDGCEYWLLSLFKALGAKGFCQCFTSLWMAV